MSDHASEPATTAGHPSSAAPAAAVGVPTHATPPTPAAPPTPTPPTPAAPTDPSPVLAPASRHIPKATLVALDITPPSGGQALLKHSFAHQLALRPGEVEAAAQAAGQPGGAALARLLAGYEEGAAEPPGPAPFAAVPVDELVAFGLAVAQLRRSGNGSGGRDGDAHADRAVVAVQNLVFNTRSSRLSMINLERLEMAPAGIQRGELIATIPLAPLEETAVTHKEWSVTSREFTSIVTDSLESYSETGVTDNTELSQSTASQQQHSNQFNITGTVSGGIPVINGSASSGFTAQDSSSTSASESRKHASGLTQKASSRAKQEHKVTISTLTVTGTEETTTRTVKNPSQTQAVRIDYFSLLRTWRVRLYRYGLRAAYDIVVPEPSAAIRKDYVELAALRAALGPFVFNLPHDDITDDVRPADQAPGFPPNRKHYRYLGDLYGVQVPDPPEATKELFPNDNVPAGGGWHFYPMRFRIEDGYAVSAVTAEFHLGMLSDNPRMHYGVEGSGFERDSGDPLHDAVVLSDPPYNAFKGRTGEQNVLIFLHDVGPAWVGLKVTTARTPELFSRWQSQVWNMLHDAAQTRYLAEQQDIANRISALEDRLAGVDTLTLRREENDEIMKCVLRHLLGTEYEFMSPGAVDALRAAGVDTAHGAGFAPGVLHPPDGAWAGLRRHEDLVRFVNQAVEWENVVTFLYSYFWDAPDSWDFVRRIRHPDPTRQAFLRAGGARIVLTIRKGWEDAWVRFCEGGFKDADIPADHPYLTVAQEIAAYDDRYYPGIPPANPGRGTVRIEDTVSTECSAVIGPNPVNPALPVTLPVTSSRGFTVGAPVVIDSTRHRDLQETCTVVAVPDPGRLTVDRLLHRHDGSVTPVPVVQPGEKGELIAEWNEYTPSSGTDIQLNTNLPQMS
ncbi:hypothetical protein [Kitasatospora purpeofusca]|uniref:hypothetical protein n=1 Tax=Kitasatospora purpeofusca TaxID=67352 RepID=UPI0036920483